MGPSETNNALAPGREIIPVGDKYYAYAAAAATPHPSASLTPVSLRVGRSAGLTRHRRVIQHRGPIKGEGLVPAGGCSKKVHGFPAKLKGRIKESEYAIKQKER